MFRIYCRVLATGIAMLTGSGAAYAFDVTVSAPEPLVEDIRAASLTATLADTQQDEAPRPIDIISAAQADYGRIIALLYDQGYFGPTINILVDGREAATLTPLGASQAVRMVTLRIDPGSVFTFGNLAITPKANQTEPTPGFAPGETARVSVLRQATAAEIEGWRQDGHAKAEVADQQITARHPDKTLNATVTLDPGPRLRLGKLTITGDSAVREKRIREIAGWPSGEVFDPDTIDKVQKRLRRTGTFASGTLTEAETPNADGTLDVTALVTDQPPRRYSFGAEFGTLDGLALSALWLHRNIFGGAERLQIEGSVKGLGGDTGGIDYRLSARLSRPATFRTDLEAFVLAEAEQRDDQNLFSQSVTLEVGGVYLAREDREYSYSARLRRSKTRDDLGERDYTILAFPYVATFDRRNDKLNATSGYYAQASIAPFFAIDGTDNGVVSSLDLRTYRQFGERVTLALRGQLGSMFGPSISNAPADLLFFSGGSGTVRGQDFQSLGADLGDDIKIGGRSFVGLSSELRVKTGENLSVVGFIDAGYIGEETFIDGSGEWHSGVGLGVRYDTTIGPIRFDVAVPASGPDDGSGLEIYIGIGQAF
ncbi:autotransporter assembly complex family protein [uncultured Tateyamaria sp.]|uniref:autotransporter assembly complex protein TamA n=1 Tax=uncultured Tateyamaria sp. TaxID=455651 RepID=UPI002636453E|nr:autotransporter assembly complex family protein [uncultured Tateyamaria sp.]